MVDEQIRIRHNETLRILWDFEIKTDHQIPSRRPDLVLVNKKKKKRIRLLVDFTIPVDLKVEIKEIKSISK